MTQKLVFNAIKTPDGTLVISRHRHDFVTHQDKNGFRYSVDGGLEYLRRSWPDQAPEYQEASVYIEDGIEKIREVIEWGTNGVDGKEPFRLIKLKDMDTSHIQACLDTQMNMHPHFREAFCMELQYRKEALLGLEQSKVVDTTPETDLAPKPKRKRKLKANAKPIDNIIDSTLDELFPKGIETNFDKFD